LDLIIEFIDTLIGGNTDPPSPRMLWENCHYGSPAKSYHIIYVVWSWHLKECFALTSAVKGLYFMALFIHGPKDSAMLMSPNKGKMTVHGCHCPWLCACMR